MLSLSLFCLSACEKVVSLDLKSIPPKYVIEGVVTNESGRSRIKISSTKDFTSNNEFTGITGASVKVENRGVTYTFRDSGAGVYQHNTFRGTQGQTYLLTVTVDQQSFTASSTMPVAAAFQDLYLTRGNFAPARTVLNVRYADVLETKNYYWFQQYVNGIEQTAYGLVNDEFSEGQEIVASMLFENTTEDRSKDFKSGDRLTVEMHCIEAPFYSYLYGLYAATGFAYGSQSSNPQSNLSGGALGYFSAHTTQRKFVVIP